MAKQVGLRGTVGFLAALSGVVGCRSVLWALPGTSHNDRHVRAFDTRYLSVFCGYVRHIANGRLTAFQSLDVHKILPSPRHVVMCSVYIGKRAHPPIDGPLLGTWLALDVVLGPGK